MIKEIKESITNSDSIGLTHDSRKDVRALAKMINILIDKVNELIEEINDSKINPEFPR